MATLAKSNFDKATRPITQPYVNKGKPNKFGRGNWKPNGVHYVARVYRLVVSAVKVYDELMNSHSFLSTSRFSCVLFPDLSNYFDEYHCQ